MSQGLPMREGRRVPTVGATVRYRTVKVGEIKIFYREAGPQDGPTLLLLHGFPTASHMFRDLIPRIADHFRLIAPDLPGFGQSAMPDRDGFPFSGATQGFALPRTTCTKAFERFRLNVRRLEYRCNTPSRSPSARSDDRLLSPGDKSLREA